LRLLPASDYAQAPGFLLERYGESFDRTDTAGYSHGADAANRRWPMPEGNMLELFESNQ
jgi:hypothetical protein